MVHFFGGCYLQENARHMKLLLLLASLAMTMPAHALPDREDHLFGYGYTAGTVTTICNLVTKNVITVEAAKVFLDGYLQSLEERFIGGAKSALEYIHSRGECPKLFN